MEDRGNAYQGRLLVRFYPCLGSNAKQCQHSISPTSNTDVCWGLGDSESNTPVGNDSSRLFKFEPDMYIYIDCPWLSAEQAAESVEFRQS
jgi:hypothetical protein